MLRDRWKSVRAALEAEIGAGRFAPGDRLPNEADLCAQFDVGRHSLRRAIADLAWEGRLSVEQGRGTFVTEAPMLSYTIGPRTRRHENFARQGVDTASELLEAEKTVAPHGIAGALGLDEGAAVFHQTRLTLGNGVPVAFGSSWHPLGRFPEFGARREVFGSVTATYRSYGIEDYHRRETTMHARPARDGEATRLRLPTGGTVMVVRAVDVDPEGLPIGASEVIWAAARVRFSFESQCDEGVGND